MSERRVAEIVRQADCFRKRLVQPERHGNRASDLCNLQRMRQPRAIQVAFVIDEDLRLVDQAAKRS